MYTVSHDYYGILGVSKNATPEEIKEQYRKLIKENHPDQFKGLRARYQSKGDEDLLKVIDEKIREAGEKSKLIIEAFKVLSDPIKRKQYDEQVVEPSVSLPEISIHPTRIAFGSLLEGQNKSLTFTIENKGGPPVAVNIDWEGNKPDWGELVIEPDAEKVFPIKVTVKVDTTGITSGPKDEKILVDVDGRIHMVEVFLAVTGAVATPAPAANACPFCGMPYKTGEVFCEFCGAKLTTAPTPPAKTLFTAPPAHRHGKKVSYTTPLPGKTMNNVVEILDKLGLGGTAFVVLLVSALLYFGYSYVEKRVASANLTNSIAVYDVRRVADGDSFRINFKVRNNSTHYVIVARNDLPWPPSPILCGYWGLGPGATAEATAEDTSSPLCLKFGYEKNGTNDFLVQPGSYRASFGTKYIGPATICSEIFYDSTAEKAAATATAQVIETAEAERILAIRRETAVANEKMEEVKSVANSPNSYIDITRIATFLGSDLPFPKETGDLFLDRVHKFSTYEEFRITNKSRYTFVGLESSRSSCKCWVPGNTGLHPGESTSAYCMKIMKDVFSEPGFMPHTEERRCSYRLWIDVSPEPYHIVDARDGWLSIPFSD